LIKVSHDYSSSIYKGPARIGPTSARLQTVMEAESSVIYRRRAKSFRRGLVTFAERNGAGAAQQNKLKGARAANNN